MNRLSKSYIYKNLNNLRKAGHDVRPYIAKMVGKKEIPYEVIVFINKYSPIASLHTYNDIFAKRNKSPLFKNLINRDLPEEERAIVLSSLLNQSLISIKHNTEDRDCIQDTMNVSIILDALSNYFDTGSTQAVNEVFEMFQTIFQTLFSK